MSERVLLVCTDAEKSNFLIERLTGEGFDIVGPAPSAGAALCLASVTYPDLAIVACAPSGRRKAGEMANALARNWGVSSILLKEVPDGGVDLARETRWLARPDQVARMSRALRGQPFDTVEAA